MRISPSTILWLAAASSTVKASGEKPELITFDTGPFQTQYDAAVFLITQDLPALQKSFRWSVNSNSIVKLPIPITRVDLVVDDGSGHDIVLGTVTNPNADASVSTTAVGPSSSTSTLVPLPKMSDGADPGNRGGGGGGVLFGDGSGVLLPVGRREEDGDGPGHAPGSDVVLLTVSATASDGNVTILNPDVLANGEYTGKKMWFELIWVSSGKTYSRAFTFTANSATALSLAQQPEFRNTNPVRSQEDGSSNDDTKTTLPPATPATETTSPTSDPGLTPSGVAAASSSSGLSTGAIAGIAVGAAIVGLALLAVLAFCLIRRRRRERLAHDGPSAFRGSRATPELIAQKEANAGVEVSPHSPYSDDGAGGMLADNSHHVVAHQEEMREGRSERAPSYTPYTDRGVVAGGRERDMDADGGSSLRGSMVTGGRGTPAAPAVRHLVEEGMTEEEIRRLEEEERELDQAIEQAGAGRR